MARKGGGKDNLEQDFAALLAKHQIKTLADLDAYFSSAKPGQSPEPDYDPDDEDDEDDRPLSEDRALPPPKEDADGAENADNINENAG